MCKKCIRTLLKTFFSCHQFGRPLAGIHLFHFFSPQFNSPYLCNTRARCQHKIRVKQIEGKRLAFYKKKQRFIDLLNTILTVKFIYILNATRVFVIIICLNHFYICSVRYLSLVIM